MPELICTAELQMWQKSGSVHKPATALGKAGSAGPEDLAVLTPWNGSCCKHVHWCLCYHQQHLHCRHCFQTELAPRALQSEPVSTPSCKVACTKPKHLYAGLRSHTYQAI